MKTIVKSILLTAVLALVVAGCQKTNDDLDVSLKSATTYDKFVRSWFPGGGAEAECAEASVVLGIPNCGLSYKVEPWVDGDYDSGISIENSDGNSFDWESDGPVCIIIVKAGPGAYLYKANGATSGSIELPSNAKGISHVTFCYSEPELIITVKAFYYDGDKNKYCESTGEQAFVTTEWCGKLGVNPYPSTPWFEMITPDGLRIGEVVVENGDVTVTLDEGYTLITTYLYIGTIEDLTTNNLKLTDGCPWFSNPAVWMQSSTVGTNTDGLTFTHYDL